jgi:excisionase family DNA binding protein
MVLGSSLGYIRSRRDAAPVPGFAKEDPINEERRWLGARERRLEPGRRSLTASEAAAMIGVSVATIRGWADQGRLPSHRTVGGHRRFELEELREWLSERGAPVPTRLRAAPGRLELPRCPEFARELNSRIDQIVERVVEGYDDRVPTVAPRRSDVQLRRAASRFIRVVGDSLESGNPAASAGRAEIAGFRGGLQGESGESVLAEHMRFAAAILEEAQDIARSGAVSDDLALPCLHSIMEHALLAVARGYAMGHEGDPAE